MNCGFVPLSVPIQYRSVTCGFLISDLDGAQVVIDQADAPCSSIDCSDDKHPARRRRRRLRGANPMARPAKWSQPLTFATSSVIQCVCCATESQRRRGPCPTVQTESDNRQTRPIVEELRASGAAVVLLRISAPPPTS